MRAAFTQGRLGSLTRIIRRELQDSQETQVYKKVG